MESKFAVAALFIATLASSTIVQAQQSVRLTPIDGVAATTKPDAFVVPSTSDAKTDEWKSQSRFVEEPNRFAKMFQAQAAEAGDPRRVPMYLLIPFAHVSSQPTTASLDTRPKFSVNAPNIVKDVGALIGTLRTDN